MTKPKRGPKLATVIGTYHDKYDLLRDSLERDLAPRLDLTSTSDAQIVQLARDIVTCLKIRRIEATGYDPEGVVNNNDP